MADPVVVVTGAIGGSGVTTQWSIGLPFTIAGASNVTVIDTGDTTAATTLVGASIGPMGVTAAVAADGCPAAPFVATACTSNVYAVPLLSELTVWSSCAAGHRVGGAGGEVAHPVRRDHRAVRRRSGPHDGHAAVARRGRDARRRARHQRLDDSG